jgi:hypothetical protein
MFIPDRRIRIFSIPDPGSASNTAGNIILPTPTDGVVFNSHADYGDVLVLILSLYQLVQSVITKTMKRYSGVSYSSLPYKVCKYRYEITSVTNSHGCSILNSGNYKGTL